MKRTKEISEKLSQLEDVRIFFEEMANEMQDEFDGKSEKWQNSDKGQEMEQAQYDLENAAQELETIYNKIADEIFPAE
jgi:hypothetical protein